MFSISDKGKLRCPVVVIHPVSRFFEWVAPSGVLQQGTHPLDGIQGVMDPEELRWPQDLPQDERFCNSLNPNHVDNYAFRVAKMHVEDWSNQFAANNCGKWVVQQDVNV